MAVTRDGEQRRNQVRELAESEDGNARTSTNFRRALQRTIYPRQFLAAMPKVRSQVEQPRTPAPEITTWRSPDVMQEQADRNNQIVQDLEAAYLTGQRFGVPFSWVAGQDAGDMALLMDPDVQQVLVGEASLDNSFRRRVDGWQKKIDTRTDEILQGRENRQNFFENLITTAIGGPGLADALPDFTQGFTEEERAAAQREAETEFMGEVAPLKDAGFWTIGDPINDTGPGGLSIAGLFRGLEPIMKWTVGAAMLVAEGQARLSTHSHTGPLTIMAREFQESQESLREEAVEVLEMPEQKKIEAAREVYGEAALQAVIDSGGLEEYKEMALYDPAITLALAEQAIGWASENTVSGREQVETLAESLDADQEAFIQTLDENNFSVDQAALSVISWYGHNVPMRLATYATVAFSQDDMVDVFASDRMQELHEQAVNAEFSPAKVLGIDGTLLGTMTDLFGGIAFDPTTWVFGPRALGGASHADDALRLAKSPSFRQMIKDAAQSLRSPTRTDMQSLALLDDIDNFGMYDEFYAASAGVDSVNGSRPWLDTPEGKLAREVPVDRVLAMLPDDVVAKGQAIARTLADDAVSWDTPAAVLLNRAANGLSMSPEDVARILVAQRAAGGTTAVPVYGRVTESVVNLDAVKAFEDVRANPGDYVFHTSKSTIEGEWTGGGISHRPMSRTDRAAFSGQRLYFRRSDIAAVLDERALKYFENGGDIERLLPQGYKYPAGESPRPNRPIATGPMPQPVLKLTRDEIAYIQHGTPEFRPLPEQGVFPVEGDADFALNSLFDEASLYPELAEAMPRLEAIAERVIKLGGGNQYPQRLIMSKTFARGFRDALRNGEKIGPWITRFFTKQNISPWVRTSGFGWQSEFRHNIIRLFPDDAEANFWLRRFREATRGDTAALPRLQAELKTITDELLSLDDQLGGTLASLDDIPPPSALDEVVEALPEGQIVDEAAEAIPAPVEPAPVEAPPIEAGATARFAPLIERRNALRAQEAQTLHKIAETTLENQARAGEAAAKLAREMQADFNRKYIASNPYWAKHVGADGQVPWEVMTRGTLNVGERTRTTLPKSVADEALEKLGIQPNAVMRDLLERQMDAGVLMPMAPIDMIAAAELGGARWLRWQQARWGENLQKTANFLDRLWKIDKVFRLSTAATVSFDELLRIFHTYGHRAVFQYLEDKVMFRSANVKVARAPAQGSADLMSTNRAIFKNKRWNERMRTLQEYPEFYKQLERQYYEHFGDSWTDIARGEAEWLPAMDQWTSNLLQLDSFRSFLGGPEAYAAFWRSERAGYLRSQSAFDWGTGHTRVATQDEAFKGMEFLVNEVILGKVRPGRRDAVRKALNDAARRLDAGEIEVRLAPDILREINMPVRGVKNQAPNTQLAGKLTNTFFDELFMTPTNYRRGFLADLARTAESTRLHKLYASQGLKIIPDHQVNQTLGVMGLRTDGRLGLSEAMEQILVQRGFVPESMIARLAERRAMAEMEHTMYTWHMTSRAGRSAIGRAAVPFGKPWADMWGFYGRELFTRPALRGYINNTNFANIGNIANAITDRLPFNPKPAAMVSRIAATDFNADKGIFPGGPSADFSPLLFLPKEGESAFMSVFPGLGLLPMWMGDWILTNLYDPFEQPEEYQRVVDSVAAFVPPFGYQQTGLAARTLGGGLFSTVLRTAVDTFSMGSGRIMHEPLAILGDIQSELQTNRALKNILADPQEWADLLEARETQLPGMFEAIIQDSFTRGAGGHATDLVARWSVPVDFDFDTTDDDVRQIWLDAAQKFPTLQGSHFIPGAPEHLLDQQADNVRRLFFDMPAQERDRMIVEYPQLAVNLVSGWEWTDKARSDFPTVSGVPYRSSGGGEGLARHQSYIRNDYIRPLQPQTLMARIIGTVFDARVTLAKQVYTDQANATNDFIWEERMPEAGRAFFEEVAASGIVDVDTGRELWQRFSAYKDKVDAEYGTTNIPEALQAWGTSWEGLDDEDFSRRFREMELGQDWSIFPESVQESARVLGLELEPGMTGEQLVAQIHEVVRDNMSGSALPSFVHAEYDVFSKARTAAFTAGRDSLNSLTAGDQPFHEDFKNTVRDFVSYADRTTDLRAENGVIDPVRARNVVEQYKALMTNNPDLNFSWEDTWRETYEPAFGPLDYEYPTPPPLDPQSATTYRPFIWDIKDGDTMVVSRSRNAPFLDLPGSRFDIEGQGQPQLHEVRLLGISAPELSVEEGKRWLDQLTAAIIEAKENNTPIYLVRDPDNSQTDFFGRELAWLYIGDEAYYHPETITPGE